MERQLEAERVQVEQKEKLERHRRILDQEVARYQREGWVVVNRTNTTAQLQKSVPVFPLWLVITVAILTLGIGWLLLGLFRKTATLFIEVDENGRVHKASHR